MTKHDDATPPMAVPAWESAADIPAWVPLRHLRHAVVLAIGEAGADAVTSEIMQAIELGRIDTRWSADLTTWREREKQRGRTLQDTYTYRAHPGRRLVPPGAALSAEGFKLALAEGVGLAIEGRGHWLPVGPVELAWPGLEALLRWRDALARSAALTAATASAAAVAGERSADNPDARRSVARTPRPDVRRFVRSLADEARAAGRKLTQAEAETRAAEHLNAPRAWVREEFARLPSSHKHTHGGRPKKARSRKGLGRP